MNHEIHVRQMKAADLPQVAQVHSIAFKGFFLDAMGQPFLRAYYGVVLRYPDSIALVAQYSSGSVVGFAVGFVDPGGFYAFLKRQWARLLPGACYALLRRPQLLGRIVLSNLRVRKKSKAPAGPAEAGTIELASIASATRASGVGSRLVEAFLEQAGRTRGTRVALTTDMNDNQAVQQFYRKHGFAEAGVVHQGTRAMLSFVRDVPGAAGSTINNQLS